jgi:hypothetical protein
MLQVLCLWYCFTQHKSSFFVAGFDPLIWEFYGVEIKCAERTTLF